MIMTQDEKSWYIVGFADGEGSFNCSWRKRDDYLIGWKITPVFNISQKERTILALIKEHLRCGEIRFRKDGVWVYEVQRRKAPLEIIIPFFERHPVLSEKKRRDFTRFKKMVNLIYQRNESKTCQDVTLLLQLVADVEAKHARKYSNEEILGRAEDFYLRNRGKIASKNRKKSAKE